jgi:hypothetical protein
MELRLNSGGQSTDKLTECVDDAGVWDGGGVSSAGDDGSWLMAEG